MADTEPNPTNDASWVDSKGALNVDAAHGVLANDGGGDLAVVQVENQNGSVVPGQPLVGTYGTLTLHADGSYTYTADRAQALAPGQFATDSFTYQGENPAGVTFAATLTITVSASNTHLISATQTGSGGNDVSFAPVIAPDGTYLAFVSNATNLIAGDAGQVFLKVLPTGLLSSPSAQAGGFGSINSVSISDRRIPEHLGAAAVTYAREVGNSTTGTVYTLQADQNGNVGFVHSISPGDQPVFGFGYDTGGGDDNVLVYQSGSQLIDYALGKVIGTGDEASVGTTLVAFHSDATNFVAGASGDQIYVYNGGSVTLASSLDGTAATEGNAPSANPHMSNDNKYVVFDSTATNLVPGASGGQVYLKNLSTGAITLVSSLDGTAATEGNNVSGNAWIAGDRYVVFTSAATNLVPGGPGEQVYAKDLDTGAISLVSSVDGTAATEGNFPSFAASVTADGKTVAYESFATNLIPGLTTSSTNIFTTTVLPQLAIGSAGADIVVNSASASFGTLTLVGTASWVETGQTVTVELNGTDYTGGVQDNGSWSVTIPQADLGALPLGDAALTAQVTDKEGNTADAGKTLVVAALSITGTAQEGQTLTAGASDGNPNATFAYQWQGSADGNTWSNISGASASTYTLQETDENDFIRVLASFTDGTNQPVSTVSDATSKVLDNSSLSLAITGIAKENATLTAVPTVGDGDDAGATVSYQWQSSTDNGTTWSNIAGQTGSTYLVVEADETDLIRVHGSFTDGTNQLVRADSGPTAPVMDNGTLSVLVSGTPQEDSTLTATPTIGDADDAGATVSYQWQHSSDGVTFTNIAGATASTYTAAEADENDLVRVHGSFVDETGQMVAADSNATTAVKDVPPTLSVSQAGNPVEGSILTASPILMTDADRGAADVTYQWQRSNDNGATWANIAGANASTYTLADGDENGLVRVAASFSDDTGQSITADSNATTAVKDVAPTLSVTQSGAALEGATLTASALLTTDADQGLADVTYQWQTSTDNGATWSNIAGATGSAYLVQQADEGSKLRVEAFFTDDTFQATSATSAATGRILMPPPQVISFSPDTGVKGDFTTAAQTITVTGAAVANSTVRLFDGSAQIGIATADGSGNWSIFGQSLPAGQNILSAIATDSLGHTSDPSSTIVVTVDPNAPDTAPVVKASSFNTNQGQSVSLVTTANISASDADGDPITEFQLYQNALPASLAGQDGHLLINGQVQPTGQPIDVTPAELANVQFVGAQFNGPSGIDVLWIRATDGQEFSPWVSFSATTPVSVALPFPNQPAMVSVSNLTEAHGTVLDGAQLVTAHDPDGDRITSYQFWDDGRALGTGDDGTDPTAGFFTLDGQHEAEGAAVEVTAAQLSSLTFTPSGTSIIWARANDGFGYGTWVSFTVSAPLDTGPTVTVANQTIVKNAIVSASQLGVTAADTNDGDAVAAYQFWDGTTDSTSGHFVLDGVAQAAKQNVTVTATQLAADDLMFQAGDGPGGVGSSDLVWVRAADSLGFYGAWQSFTINAPNQAPVVTLTLPAGGVNLNVGDPTVAAASLFTASDPDSDPITQYEFWDDNTAPGTADDNPNPDTTGHFLVDGTQQPHGQGIFVTPDQLPDVVFKEGTQATQQILWVRANDGTVWSDWVSFTVNETVNVTPKGNTAPIVTAPDIPASTGESFTAGQLFTATPGNSSTHITAVRFWDGGSDTPPLGGIGHFELNGQTLPEKQNIEVDAANLASLTFQTGSGADLVWVQASDGFSWSDWVSFHVDAPVDPGPPVLTTADASLTTNETVPASTLFGASDPVATIQNYEFWQQQTSTGAHFDLNGVAVQGYNQNIDVTAANLGQLTFDTGTKAGSDVVWMRANDGVEWSAWQSFTANVTDPATGAIAGSNADIAIADGALSEITGASSASVAFQGSTGTLQLDQSSGFAGTIAGFTGQDQIDLTGILGARATLAYQDDGFGSGGTLSVTDGAHSAQLALLGQYAAGNFSLGIDSHGGTIVNDPPLVGPIAPSIDPALAPNNRPTSVST